MTQLNKLVQFGQNFDLKIRREHEKKSYECRVYESVDDRSPFMAISRKSVEIIIHYNWLQKSLIVTNVRRRSIFFIIY